MDFLSLIWQASLVLAGVSPAIMLVLIIRRSFMTRREKRFDNRKNELFLIILDYLDKNISIEEIRNSLHREDKGILGNTVSDLLRVIRGEDSRRLTDLLIHIGALDFLLGKARTGNLHYRADAIANLAYFNSPEVLDFLKSALDDPAPAIRITAARSLIELGAIDSVRLLLDKLDIGTAARSQALINLFRRLGANAVPQLVEILNDKNTPPAENVKILAMESLGQLGDLQAVPTLLTLAADPALDVQACALRALANLQSPEALPAILNGLNSPAWQIRTQAAICAGRVGTPEAIPALLALLEEDNWWVRYRTACAIFALGDPGKAALRKACNGPPRTAEIAQTVFGERGVAL